MAPPAKRQKRNVIPSSPRSDDLDTDKVPDSSLRHRGNANNRASAAVIDLCSSPIEDASQFTREPPKQAPTPSKSRQSTLQNSNVAPASRPPVKSANVRSRSATTSASPEKKKRAPAKAEKGKNGNLFTFFSTQVNKQIASITPPTSGTGKEEEDISTDDDDEILESKVRLNTSFTSTATKRNRSLLESNGESSIVSSSQRFKKPSVSAPTKPKVEEDLRPWAERFAPQNLEELAVHTRKVADVRGWLESVMAGKSRQRVLILKGAAGTGKTTTVQLLAKAMGAEVLEWRNPLGSTNDGEGGGFVSVIQQFEDFLGRGGKFGQLDIFDESDVKTAKPEPDSRPLDHKKSLLLVEEFPNTFTKSSTVLQGFRSAIITYLAANTSSQAEYYSGLASKNPVIPLVMVISENLLTTTSAAADSFTAHRLLGPEILHHPSVTVKEFNPIAPTFLQRALELVVMKESRKSGRRKTPGPLVLKRLGEIGDIRSAIGNLEFLCLQGDDADWGANINFASGKGRKKTAKDTALTKMEEESLELVTRREASLGIFHAVGRVVYNKRETGPSNEALPNYLAKMARPKRSEVVVEGLIDETGTDTSTFLSSLHENYVLSCNAVDRFPFYSDMDHVNVCIDALSDADLMAPSWDVSFNPNGFGGGSGGRGAGADVQRQDELSFQVAVRGILFGLPDPVTRKAPKEGGLRKGVGREGHQMFYPTSLKLWRKKEEIEGMVDTSVTKVMKGEQRPASGVLVGAAAFRRPKLGVETWTSSHGMALPPCPTQYGGAQAEKSADHTPLLVGLGGCARKEMLLERLPYLVKIAKAPSRGKPSVLLPLELSDLEKITKFTGIGAAKEEDEEETGPGDEMGAENWATDRPTEGGSSPQKRRKATDRGMLSGSRHDARMVAEQLEKTVLSDDDIED